MVTCWDCLRTLPYDCVCSVSNKTKSLMWAEKAIRELELFTAVLEGFIPIIKINGKSYVAETKIIDAGSIKLSLEVEVKKGDDLSPVLLDKNDAPLFRRVYSKENLVNVVSSHISWNIGTSKEVN